MYDILKIALVFVLMVILLRRKLVIGYVLLVSATALAVLYKMPPTEVLQTVKATLIDPVTIKLAIALTAIRAFEMVLRENNIMNEMMHASKTALKKKKAVIVSMPLLIGLLPSVGGAYFSAPMVEESTKGMNLSQEEKGFINYWYRHPWEFILPLYPGIVLASAISRIEMGKLMLANLPYAIMVFLTGFVFSMKTAKGVYKKGSGLTAKSFLSFIPIAVVLLLVVVFKLELHYALLACMAGLFVVYQYGFKKMYLALRHGFSVDVLTLILGTMLFKHVMDASGSVNNLSDYFTSQGIPLLPMLFALPFISGLLTGITVGFVGSTLPLVIKLAELHPDVSIVAAVSFAFASGFLGVLLSPVHVCLVLTREYFNADLWGMYKRIIPASLITFATAFAVFYFLK